MDFALHLFVSVVTLCVCTYDEPGMYSSVEKRGTDSLLVYAIRTDSICMGAWVYLSPYLVIYIYLWILLSSYLCLWIHCVYVRTYNDRNKYSSIEQNIWNLRDRFGVDIEMVLTG